MTDKKTEQQEPTTEKKAELTKTGEKYPEVQPGRVVRVHEKITEVNPKGEEKQRIQIFEGMVLARKHGSDVNATITVRKTTDGIGVEKIFPLASPIIEKIEVTRTYKVKRAKLGFLRNYFKKLKEIKK